MFFICISTREVNINQTKILRIIDFIGDIDIISHIGSAIQNLIYKNNYEYIDFYCDGIKQSIMNNAGFKLNDSLENNSIPNYFEPFVRENIEIHYFTTSIANDFTIFKGDGDQDRPNFIFK